MISARITFRSTWAAKWDPSDFRKAQPIEIEEPVARKPSRFGKSAMCHAGHMKTNTTKNTRSATSPPRGAEETGIEDEDEE